MNTEWQIDLLMGCHETSNNFYKSINQAYCINGSIGEAVFEDDCIVNNCSLHNPRSRG
jgi:hypothetical protein